MFDNFGQRVETAIHKLKGRGKITEINISETLKEIRRALVEADVNYNVAKGFIDRVKVKAIGEKVITSLRPDQLIVKIVRDELRDLMGGDMKEININNNPSVILMSGLQGSGKTTFSSKLANYLKNKKGRKVLLVGCDVYRPAAMEQLKVMAQKIDVDIYLEEESKDPVKISTNAIAHAKLHGHNVIIIDTAGRLAIDTEMMKEISNIHKAVKPSETLFVVDAMTGQDAVNTAKAFNDILNFDGVILTKLDGDTRGGAAFSIKYVVGKPVKFVGVGEKIDDIEIFHPDRIANRILGMGDVVSLVEKIQESHNDDENKKIRKRIAKDQFGLDDYLAQINQIRNMGGVKNILSMLPGGGNLVKNLEIDNSIFLVIEALIRSMTPKERRMPEIINHSRKQRIVKGSGRSIEEMNRMMKQFEEMKKMMKMTKNSGSINAFKNIFK